VTNARFAALHRLDGRPHFPDAHARSVPQKTRSSRAAMGLAARAAGFRLRFGGGVALRLRSRRLSASALLHPLADCIPKPSKSRNPRMFFLSLNRTDKFQNGFCFGSASSTKFKKNTFGNFSIFCARQKKKLQYARNRWNLAYKSHLMVCLMN
jgi:hypothetical protein